MPKLMRCTYCGLLQDEPKGVKDCSRCGGELAFVVTVHDHSYVRAQLELDQIFAPAGQIVDRHLILTIDTPLEVPADEAAPTKTGREPMGFSAVLDVSGSMRGPKLEAAKEAVRQSVHRLKDGDVFSLVTFANEVKTRVAPAVVDGPLRLRVERTLDKIRSGGRTALCGGLESGISAATKRRRESNLVLLLSDGQANVGETDLESVGQRSYDAGKLGITTSTLGVGRDYNEALMVEIAIQGGGRFYHVLESHQIAPYVAGEVGEVSALAAKKTELHLSLPGGTGVQPFSTAYAVHSQSDVHIGDIPVSSHLEVVIRVLLPPQSDGSRLPIEGSLTYESPAGHSLTTKLNPVTLRFSSADGFGLRDGAVLPVVERVLDQMRARSMLSFARTTAVKGAAAADKESEVAVDDVRRYAQLLGEEAAEEAALDQQRMYMAARSRPAAAKAAVADAFSLQRGAKRFDKS